ncbi:Glycoside hydrolase family 19 domain protein [Candidatus Trichorickettsia mobilis]|uniref:Glycoside hydrolase family 19 domain protein n=1 Tax=Candidatus Trichorickettsia mobilis TaxID=1346319 RepID=A0ABZ0UTL1_9RICK|nr:glycoside hydrolase family 19 protein [Candidatus Trichorickettsia mobilis]WPY01383.1 Glycoside hydrolase family 19 domain protein [Candidatus Trichorickettsia mobilis]
MIYRALFMVAFVNSEYSKRLWKFLAVGITLYIILCKTAYGYDACVTGQAYLANDLCTVGDGDKCVLWKAQWWINTAPGTDPAWKNMGSCDGKAGGGGEPVVVAPKGPSIEEMNIIMDALVREAESKQKTTDTGVAKWLTEIQSQIPAADYTRLLDVAYYVRTLPLDVVAKIKAGKSDNPENVKRVEKIISESTWNTLFPLTNNSTKEGTPEGIGIYTYENFLKAVGAFPAFCGNYAKHPKLKGVDADQICKKLLATTFAHFNKETSANASAWTTRVEKQGLYYIREANCINGMTNYCKTDYLLGAAVYPASLQEGNAYFGRGAKQLSHPVNYATLSILLFDKPDVLLKYPDLVSTTWLALGSAVYFASTPISSKPAMIEVIDGNYQPNAVDQSRNFVPGFGLTTHIINGAYECIPLDKDLKTDDSGTPYWKVRANYYKYFAATLGVSGTIDENSLSCSKMKSNFDTTSAASRPYYFAPGACNPVQWEPVPTFIAYGGSTTLALCKATK